QQVLAHGQLALLGRGTVGQDGAGLDAVALVEQHALVVGVAGDGALELPDRVGLAGAVVGHDHDEVGRELLDDTALLGDDHITGVYSVPWSAMIAPRSGERSSMATPFSSTTTSPESTAARRSMPVPTSGISARSSGTAWRCMFEPMSARLASSCSRKGIIAVATETI